MPDKPDYAHPITITGNTYITTERVYVCYTSYGGSAYVLNLDGNRISSQSNSGDKYINVFNGYIEKGHELSSAHLSIANITRVYPLTF